MNKKYLAMLLMLLGVLTQFTNAQKVITENGTGKIDGYDYSLWKDRVILK